MQKKIKKTTIFTGEELLYYPDGTKDRDEDDKKTISGMIRFIFQPVIYDKGVNFFF